MDKYGGDARSIIEYVPIWDLEIIIMKLIAMVEPGMDFSLSGYCGAIKVIVEKSLDIAWGKRWIQ